MNMLRWIWNALFGGSRPEVSSDCVDDDDSMIREAVARCFNSGKIVIGNRDSKGNVEFREVEPVGNQRMSDVNLRTIQRLESACIATKIAAAIADELRKWWKFDSYQQPTASWHCREDFITKMLPKMLVENAELGTLQETNERLGDLVRYCRSELHEDGMITDEEYATICDNPGAGDRLHGYDAIQKELAELKKENAALKSSEVDVVCPSCEGRGYSCFFSPWVQNRETRQCDLCKGQKTMRCRVAVSVESEGK